MYDITINKLSNKSLYTFSDIQNGSDLGGARLSV